MVILRLLRIHHLVHRAPGDSRLQWDLIDDHLDAVRQNSYLELQASLGYPSIPLYRMAAISSIAMWAVVFDSREGVQRLPKT
ncbi:hypothetical protein MJO28_016303 [Puccinia striiformis f. sp. tritici]|uniref:Uncharacterized protein n=1 Tax=Puccinia striiformis f. sp. tritici TaxID=168172 RepID=A0ACC0DN12_9BASI|nr:hypothetical protein MJO28_016303 [Puccinia striiformis f. sp. tritici]